MSCAVHDYNLIFFPVYKLAIHPIGRNYFRWGDSSEICHCQLARAKSIFGYLCRKTFKLVKIPGKVIVDHYRLGYFDIIFVISIPAHRDKSLQKIDIWPLCIFWHDWLTYICYKSIFVEFYLYIKTISCESKGFSCVFNHSPTNSTCIVFPYRN